MALRKAGRLPEPSSSLRMDKSVCVVSLHRNWSTLAKESTRRAVIGKRGQPERRFGSFHRRNRHLITAHSGAHPAGADGINENVGATQFFCQ